jgi:hypothetical protein
VCGCGDPSLFQWFLAWPAHALTSGHSLVFSRDLFYPHGVNLLANTSVLGLGVPLAPVTWLGGPVLTQNVALLLSIPFAVWTMDLLLRRLTTSIASRVVLSLLYGFSPYVIASLAISHLMTAWIGILPLIALGVYDLLGEDERRARRGAVLLVVAIVAQFFVSTELLLLAAIVTGIALVVAGISWLVSRRPADGPVLVVRRLAPPIVVSGVLLAVPAFYALAGPRSLKGNIWGPGFNPATGGTSLNDLFRPNVVRAGLTVVSGYGGGRLVQLQYLGWGLLGVAAIVAVWQWRDAIVRVAAVTSLACLVLALSPTSVSWAPWQWIGRLPVLQNVLQFRLAVFAMLGAIVVIARGVGSLERLGRAGVLAGAVALGFVAVPIAIPVAQSLPLRTVHVATPAWWHRASGPAVVLAYPYPGDVMQSALTWQARGSFAVSMLGGSGPQSTVSRAGADARATMILDDLSTLVEYLPVKGPARPLATPATAGPVRAMVRRDGVSVVVVPIRLHGKWIQTGAPSAGAAVFFEQVLGLSATIERGSWVFSVHGALPAPRFASTTAQIGCATSVALAPSTLTACLTAGTSR